MKIKQFDRATLDLLKQELNEALAPVAEKYGITLKFEGAKYDTNSAILRFNAVTTDGETAAGRARKEWLQHASAYGCDVAWLDKQFLTFGPKPQLYKVVGLASNRSKNVVIAERVKDGKRFVFAADMVGFYITKLTPSHDVATLEVAHDRAAQIAKSGKEIGESVRDILNWRTANRQATK